MASSKWLELITNEKGVLSMSQVITLTCVLVILVIVLADVFFEFEISPTSVGLLIFIGIIALANRADSRRISLKFKDLEFSQDRSKPELTEEEEV